MLRFNIHDGSVSIYHNSKEIDLSQVEEKLKESGLRPRFRLSLEALFFIAWASLMNWGFANKLLKDEPILWYQYLVLVFGNLAALAHLHSVKPVRIKITGERKDLKTIKSKLKVIKKSLGPFGIQKTANSKAFQGSPDKFKKYFKSNIKFPCYRFGEQVICFFPFFSMVIEKDGDVSVAEYKKFYAGHREVFLFQCPKDGDITGRAWEKSNKDGSRDKRFKNNRQIYKIACYGFQVQGQKETFYFYNSEVKEILNSFSRARFTPIERIGNSERQAA